MSAALPLWALDAGLVETHAPGLFEIEIRNTNTGVLTEAMLDAVFARARVAKASLSDRIEVLQVTGGALPFDDASFEVVFSKDSLVQIPDKRSLFEEVHRVLVPRGQFIASDWLRGGSGAYSAEMLDYFRLEGITYNMSSAEDTAAALTDAGFVDIDVKDRNAWYLAVAERELRSMRGEWLPVLESRLGFERAQHFVANWEQLVLVLRRGELRPSHLKAAKP